MSETDDDRSGAMSTSDREVGAPRPSRTGSVPTLGFDDPSLRPLPPEQIEYHIPHPDAHPERHEHSDVPIRPLAISLAAIALTMVGTFVFLYFLFFHYKAQQEALEVRRTAVPTAKPAVEGPRLQGVPGFNPLPPKEEMNQLRNQFDVELSRYGKSGEDGFVRVPIDRAMQLAIERGLFKTGQPAPTRPAAPPPPSPAREEGVR